LLVVAVQVVLETKVAVVVEVKFSIPLLLHSLRARRLAYQLELAV
jgi:hypothetical protein